MITRSVAQLLAEHVTLDVEGIDRLYLNAYQPRLQTGAGVAAFFKGHRGARVVSTTLMAPMSRAFVGESERFARREEMEVVRFTKGQRKDTVTKDRLKRFNEPEGLLYLGIAQERCSTFRVEKRVSPQTGKTFPWLGRSTVMCNQYYFYLVDQDFGPFFIKFSGYFPYTARICLNGHEYAKRQLDKEGIAYEPLDDGIRSCEAPERLQQILDAFDEAKIEGVAGNGSSASLTPLPRPTVRPVLPITSLSCRPSLPELKCLTARSRGVICLKRSCGRTLIWVVLVKSALSSIVESIVTLQGPSAAASSRKA